MCVHVRVCELCPLMPHGKSLHVYENYVLGRTGTCVHYGSVLNWHSTRSGSL